MSFIVQYHPVDIQINVSDEEIPLLLRAFELAHLTQGGYSDIKPILADENPTINDLVIAGATKCALDILGNSARLIPTQTN